MLRELTGRVVSIILAAVAGSAFGSALYRRLHPPDEETAQAPIPVPMVTSIAATAVGLISHLVMRRRGWIPAFAFGAVASALIGPTLDRKLWPPDQSASASATSSSQSSA